MGHRQEQLPHSSQKDGLNGHPRHASETSKMAETILVIAEQREGK